MNYDEMAAGSEMDRAVALHVMGWSLSEWINSRYFTPSRKIECAWRVVERMRERFSRIDVTAMRDGYACSIEQWSEEAREEVIAAIEAETAPLAISRAALAALKSTQKEM